MPHGPNWMLPADVCPKVGFEDIAIDFLQAHF